MKKYLRFLCGPVLVMVAIAGVAWGGSWMWLGFAITMAVSIAGDAFLGDDVGEPDYRHPWIFMLMMYSALPLLAILALVYAWMLGSGDFLGIGTLAQSYLGWDMFAARADTSALDLVGATLSTGLLFAVSGTDVGHELTHRTTEPVSMFFGRWMLAFTWDAQFAIEHVYGHHERVCTPRDPATAYRGENAYHFIVRSTLGQVRSAWRLEKERLAKRDIPLWSWRNRMLRGWLMTGAITLMFFVAAGWLGAALFTVSALFGKSVLEVVNYFEHYGLVRVDGEPVQPRHSWNSNRNMSNLILHNVTRHSHHHAKGDVPFWELRSFPDAPTLPYGYLTSLLIIYLAPGLYKRMMTPKLIEWDRHYATPQERVLAAEQNRNSRIDELSAAAT